MKIMIWLPAGFWPAIGGIESFTTTLALDLKAQGHDIFVLAFQNDCSSPAYEQRHGIEIYRFLSAPSASGQEKLATIKAINVLLKTISPHILHMQYTANANLIYYFMLQKHLKIPMILTTHGLLCSENNSIYSELVEQAHRVVCVSRDIYHESLKINPAINKTSWIHNALPIINDAFSPPDFNPPKFLCLGRFTYEKGYDLAIKAFAMLIKHYPQAELILAGDGVERDNLIQLALSLGVGSTVRFTGSLNQEQCVNVLKEASVVLIPSHYESFGLVALEAGMLGRPVIASHVGGLSEIITNNTGILIKPNCVHVLHQAMSSLCIDSDLAQKMGRAAYRHIREHFSSNKMISSYEDIYRIAWSEHHEKISRQLLAKQNTNVASQCSVV